MRLLAALVIAVGVMASTGGSAAAGPRVGLIDVPEDLETALRISLEPWGISLEPVAGPPPSGDAADVQAAAAAQARTARWDALLWVTANAGAVTIWLYDHASGELSLRPMPATRDPATAAALALWAKTMLRTTEVAPAPERFGATVPARPPTAAGRLRVHASLGMRRMGPGDFESRLGVALSWWPARLRGYAGVVLGAESGPGLSVDGAVLARFTDSSGFAALRGRAKLGARFAIDGGAGLSLHATSLDGFSPEHRIAVQVTRVNAAVDAVAAVAVAVGPRTELAFAATTGVALQRQRYLIGGAPILELPAVELRLGIELRVEMP